MDFGTITMKRIRQMPRAKMSGAINRAPSCRASDSRLSLRERKLLRSNSRHCLSQSERRRSDAATDCKSVVQPRTCCGSLSRSSSAIAFIPLVFALLIAMLSSTAIAEDAKPMPAKPAQNDAPAKAPAAEKPDGGNAIKNVIEGFFGGRKPALQPARAVPVQRIEAIGFEADIVIDADGVRTPRKASADNEKLTPATSLTTNEDLERLLEQADKLVAANRADLAPTLWQKVLDEGGAVLATQRQGRIETLQHIYQSYRPLAEEAEGRIAAAGPAGLRAYRLQANGQTRLLLGPVAPEDIAFDAIEARERTLNEVVQRYFLSASGDNAAFELACRLLERESYIPAAALLLKLQSHPDCDVPEKDIAVRLIVALARSGAAPLAEELFGKTSGLFEPDVRALVRADLDRFKGQTSNSTRSEVLANDPLTAAGKTDVALKWSYQPLFVLKKPPKRQQPNRGIQIMVRNGQQVLMEVDERGQTKELLTDLATWPDMTRKEVANSWVSLNWTPASTVLLAGSRMLVKSQERLVCCDVESGKVVWMGRKTKFPLDPRVEQSQMYELIGWRVAANAPLRPKGIVDATLFGDRLAHAVTVDGDLAINIEGELDYGSKAAPVATDENQFGFHFDPTANASRVNHLSAYDLRTGKLRWNRRLSDKADVIEAGAVSQPIATKQGLLVATIVKKQLEIVLLDSATGSTKWRSTLFDAVSNDAEVWAPLSIENEGDSLFVSTGYGAIFALQLTTGRIEWASAYPRKRTEADLNMQAMMGRGVPQTNVTPNVAAPQANYVKCWNDLLITVGADSDQVMAFDRRTGTLRWEAPLAPLNRMPCREVIGIHRDLLIVSGPHTVRGYGLKGGRMQWESALQTITGRGVLTADSIYVPQTNRIARLQPTTGTEIGSFVPPTIDELPVGNLTTDGKQIFVTGPGVVLALTPAAPTALKQTEEK